MIKNIEGGFNDVPVTALSPQAKFAFTIFYGVCGAIGLTVGVVTEDPLLATLGVVGLGAGGGYLYSAAR